MPNQNPFKSGAPVRPVASHPRQDYTIGPNRRISPSQELANKYDWFKPIHEQLMTLREQPVAKVAGLASEYLGDPTDPANLAVGWIPIGSRRALASEKFTNLLMEAASKRNPKLKTANQALAKVVDKYPNVAAHIKDISIDEKMGFGTYGRALNPPINPELQPERTAKLLKDRAKSGYSFDDAVNELQKSYPETVRNYRHGVEGTRPSWVESHINSPYVRPEDKTNLVAYFNTSVDDSTKKIKEWAEPLMPSHRGYAKLNPDSAHPDETARHEFGHWALHLKDDPTSTVRQAEHGYWLNPSEIRARAIQEKARVPPSFEIPKDKGPARITPEGKSVERSRPQYDYMKRITNSIQTGMRESEEAKRKGWLKAFNSGDILLPRQYYDYLKGAGAADLQRIKYWADGLF